MSFEYMTPATGYDISPVWLEDAINFISVYTLLFPLPPETHFPLLRLTLVPTPHQYLPIFILWLTETQAGFLCNFDEDSPMFFHDCVCSYAAIEIIIIIKNEWIWIKL